MQRATLRHRQTEAVQSRRLHQPLAQLLQEVAQRTAPRSRSRGLRSTHHSTVARPSQAMSSGETVAQAVLWLISPRSAQASRERSPPQSQLAIRTNTRSRPSTCTALVRSAPRSRWWQLPSQEHQPTCNQSHMEQPRSPSAGLLQLTPAAWPSQTTRSTQSPLQAPVFGSQRPGPVAQQATLPLASPQAPLTPSEWQPSTLQALERAPPPSSA